MLFWFPVTAPSFSVSLPSGSFFPTSFWPCPRRPGNNRRQPLIINRLEFHLRITLLPDDPASISLQAGSVDEAQIGVADALRRRSVNKPPPPARSMPSLSLSPSLWETVKCDFKELFPEDVFQMWFEPMVCLETTEDAMTLGVPNDFGAVWIHDNYCDLI